MESNINSYKLVQKNIQYTLTTSMIGESIKLSVRNDSNPGADLNRTFTVAGLKQLDELFNIINTPIEALQWIDKALRKEKVRIDGVGSSLKLVFYITTNGIGHQIEIPMIENTQAIYGQEIKTTDFLSENSIRASQAALATLTANTSITKTTMPTLEEFNREIGLDSTKIVRQTLNANTNELIQSIEDAEKKNYLINTSENVNINVSLPVTTENINTNLESTAFDLNTFQETNNQIQVGATDANIDLGQYTTTTNEQIDIANYTDSTNYNVEEINTQYLQ